MCPALSPNAQMEAEAARQQAEQEAEQLRRQMLVVEAVKDEENRQLLQQLEELRAQVYEQSRLRPPSQAAAPQQPAPAAAGLQERQEQPGQRSRSRHIRNRAGMGGRPGQDAPEGAAARSMAQALELCERRRRELDEARSMLTAARLAAAPPTQQGMEIDVEADGGEDLEEAQEDQGAARASLDRARQRLSEVREVRRQKVVDAKAKLRAFRTFQEQLEQPEWELEGLTQQQSFMQLVARLGDLPRDARVRQQGGDWQLLHQLESEVQSEYDDLQLLAAEAKTEAEVLEAGEEAAAAAQVKVAGAVLRVARAAAALRDADAAVAQAEQEKTAVGEAETLESSPPSAGEDGWAAASADEEMLDAAPLLSGGDDNSSRSLAVAAAGAEVGSGQWQASGGSFQLLPAAAHLQPALHQPPDEDGSSCSAEFSSSSSSEDINVGTNAAVSRRQRRCRNMVILRTSKPVWHPTGGRQAAVVEQRHRQQRRQEEVIDLT